MKAAPTDATTTAKLFELIKDDSVDVQSQIINYQSLSDSHLNNNVENLVLPLRSVFFFWNTCNVTFSCYRRYYRCSLSYICVKYFINVQSGKMKFEKKTYELNLEQFEATCAQLNAALQNKTYLVGNELSIGMLKIF